MNSTDFYTLVDRRVELIKSSLVKKGTEYSTDQDKLHNFKVTSQMRRGKHPAECLQGMNDKHLSSYFDMLEGIQQGKKYTRAYIDEKFGDIINYFILQEAIFVEMGLDSESLKAV